MYELVESTYGTHIHEKREDRESRFTQTVADTVQRNSSFYSFIFQIALHDFTGVCSTYNLEI